MKNHLGKSDLSGLTHNTDLAALEPNSVTISPEVARILIGAYKKLQFWESVSLMIRNDHDALHYYFKE